ncbi:pathogenesis-related thaumatin superfamily protein [Wolffia australiana]
MTMAMATAFFKFLLVVSLCARVSSGQEIQLVIVNNCNGTVWPAILGGAGHHSPEGGGFRLATGEEALFPVPSQWSGRIWGRRGCWFDENGTGSCETGDCEGRLRCGGAAGSPPATVVEMTFGTATSTLHYYDVSLVDGFNVPVEMVPVGGGVGCRTAACEVDLNVCCPSRFEVRVGGKVVGCRSACQALKTDKYCCTGEFASPESCRPTIFSALFKSLCPRALSFAFDDSSTLRTCRASRYLITFCPPRR